MYRDKLRQAFSELLGQVFDICNMLKCVLYLAAIISVSGQKNTYTVEVPSGVVTGVGSDAVFRCISQDAVNVTWRINGTSLNSLQLSDVAHSFDSTGHQGAVRFRNVPAEYNGTIVQCVVHTNSELVEAGNSTLLLQGTLSGVGDPRVSSIDNSTIFLNWTAPFTLDITFSLVDIKYCVDVVSSATLHSECGITETEFTYPLPPRSGCDEYNFTVTPVNVVGNGTTVIVLHPQDKTGSSLVDTNVGRTDISLIMSAVVCQAEVKAMDLHSPENFILREPNVTIEGTSIRFPLELLRLNRQYKLTVSVFNSTSEGHISTHDIINCTTYNDYNSITITVEFTEHSEATGALLNFIFINEDIIDFYKSISLTADKSNVLQGLTLPLDMWYPGQYMMYAYDIEDNKRIMNGAQYEASKGTLTVINGRAGSPTLTSVTNCSVDNYAGVITVVCSFFFQVTAQRNALDSVNILHVNTSMDPHTPVTLQVTDGEYLVTILPVQDGRGILSSEIQTQIITVSDTVTTQSPVSSISSSNNVTGIIVGSVLSFCLAVVMIVIVLILISTRSNGKKDVCVEAEVKSGSYNVHMPESPANLENAVEESAESQLQTHSFRGFGIETDDSDAPLLGSARSTLQPIIRNFLHI